MFFKKIRDLNEFFINRVFDFDLLLSLRGLACLCVIFTHAFISDSIVKSKPWLLWPFFLDGYGAVWVFFILSGYLMTKLFDTKKYNWSFNGLKKYYLARIRRIVPLYWFVIIFGGSLAYTSLIKFTYLPKLLSILTFTQYLFTPLDYIIVEQRWISQSWSLVVEMQYYIIAPLIAFCMIKWRNFYTIAGSLIMIYLLGFKNEFTIWLGTRVDARFGHLVIPYLPFFLFGGLILVFLSFKKIRSFLSNLVFLLPILILSLFLVPVYYKFFPDISYSDIYRTWFYLINSGLIIAIFESFSFDKPPARWNYDLRSWLNPKKYLEKIGHLSYGAYLWHLAIISSVSGAWLYSDTLSLPIHISENSFFVVRFAFTILLTFLIATITYHTIESYKKNTSSK